MKPDLRISIKHYRSRVIDELPLHGKGGFGGRGPRAASALPEFAFLATGTGLAVAEPRIAYEGFDRG